MTNPFNDIETFGTACDQPPSEANYKMYLSLVDEEMDELLEAVAANELDTVNELVTALEDETANDALNLTIAGAIIAFFN